MSELNKALAAFSPQTQSWFLHAFGQPTPAQEAAWPAIRSGANSLIVAPTGSGKTLAAFLWAIDQLMRRPPAGEAAAVKDKPGVSVLYISPLKALGADVARNLETPLAGIAAAYQEEGLEAPTVSVAVRSGDTDTKGRRAIAAHPPDILVTTPESLYLLLTSKARKILTSVRTVIIDEIHALAASKRGVHLALSLERLDLLTGRPAQRIGLSATVRPVERVAAFLGGCRPADVVAPASPSRLDLQVVDPVKDMADLDSAPASGGGDMEAGSAAGERSIWSAVERSIFQAVLAHRTTLVFVNSRGQAERLTARLNELATPAPAPASAASEGLAGSQGKDGSGVHYASTGGSISQRVCTSSSPIAMAHHGSVSKERRRMIEEALKAGDLRCVVATSSLELGIDMGAIDLVIQVAPPLSVASGLQRVGRADHQVGAESHALIYPLNRREILGAAASVEAMLEGAIEPTKVPDNPLDVLAQQTVAAVSMDDMAVDDWYHVVRQAAPYSQLDRAVFESVLAMLAGVGADERFRAFRPSLAWDQRSGVLSARPGAQRLAVTSGGTIPDRGSYTVVLPQEETGSGRAPRRVGELDEEMVYESRVGDIITLGTSSWRIQQITNDRVIVQPAPGRSARLPFWHGEGVGRDAGFGRRLGRLTRDLAAGLIPASQSPRGMAGFDSRTSRRLSRAGVDANGQGNLASLLAEQEGSTGLLPSDRELLVERCKDEEGDWRIILHSPYGARVHEPWALAISARLKRERGYDGSVYASDDGIVMRLAQEDGDLPAEDLFVFDPDRLEEEVRTAVTQSALFAGRFRQVAARSLFMPKAQPGRRVPLWLQRLRSSQLLQAAREQGSFPLLAETMRECLEDVYDLPSLRTLMKALESGQVGLGDVSTSTPSPFATGLLFGYVSAYMYQYDLPQAEQDAAMLSLDSVLLAKLIGGSQVQDLIDPSQVATLEADLQCLSPHRRKKDAEGAADLLRSLGPLSLKELSARLKPADESGSPGAGDDRGRALGFLDRLHEQGRARSVTVGGETYWASPDDAVRLESLRDGREDAPKAMRELTLVYAATHGPFTRQDLVERYGFDPSALSRLLADLEGEGLIMQWRSTAAQGSNGGPGNERGAGRQWLHQRVFQSLRSRSLKQARRAVRPVKPAAYSSFLLKRQGVGPLGRGRYRGASGLLSLLEVYEGVYLPADMWESSFLPTRVADYEPAMIDELLAAGDLIWLGRRQAGESVGSLAWYLSDSPLLALPMSRAVTGTGGAKHGQGEAAVATDLGQDSSQPILKALAAGGSYHFRQLEAICQQGGPESLDPERLAVALWRLVWQGRLTNSTLAPIRQLLGERAARHPRPSASLRRRARAAVNPRTLAGGRSLAGADRDQRLLQAASQGLWSLPQAVAMGPSQPAATEDLTRQALEAAQQVLDRDGLATSPTVNQQDAPMRFTDLYPVFKRMEDAGQLLRGAFVQGLGPTQFAEREVVSALRDQAGEPSSRTGTEAGTALVIDSRDPANLYGGVLPWPPLAEPKGSQVVRPSRRPGALVAFWQGRPALYAGVQGRHLLVFEGVNQPGLERACEELAVCLRSQRRPASFKDVNGLPFQVASPISRSLQNAGFTFGPQGMKLYR
ncbi:putative ATP-dependent helicase lhr [Bifidobacterium actinocoloniiforme DSM 22766]|uniref:Putative ATP-dependent helicase lhr n=1 Tax=Bifidobacterium actinocoloniiforme DSM 22766 TaxID=1437605 RepID=A0A086Z0S9_9BIFI|nr:ATP-dependent helicase [Bifidobacterium actinocoloniiforme]AKV55330.1 hypothetical protein AB656_02760 [Bifidobacterium actinocoloniiforme DSM 22766]KFI40129.1 putative ATP-dependent helicase lhr [Bifidobacterium actinocoloniiforme DSM 22766]